MRHNNQNNGMNVLYNKERINRFDHKKFSPGDRIRIRELRIKLRELWLPEKEKEINLWRRKFGINAKGEISDFIHFTRDQKERFFKEAESFIYIIQSEMAKSFRYLSLPKTVESCCEVLGLPDDVKQEDIRKKFRKLVLTCHPDRGGDPNDFIRIYEAYSFLMSKTPV